MEQIPELKRRYLVVNFIGLVMIVGVFICAALVEIFSGQNQENTFPIG